MNTENGWTKIKNDIHDDPLLNKDSEYLSVWIYLLTHQAFGEYQVMFWGNIITLREGQLLTSLSEISKKTGVTVSKVNRILKKLKSEKRIETQTDMQKTLITLGFVTDCEMQSEKGNEKRVKNDWKTKQETENEKEKRSKREKEKEKENNKTINTVKNNIPSISPQGETGREDFPLTEKDLDKWLEEDDGIDNWDKLQIFYKNLNSRQQPAAVSQQDCYTGNNETNGFDNTNPIQQKNKANNELPPKPPSCDPVAITQNACISSMQGIAYHRPKGAYHQPTGCIPVSNANISTLFDEFWQEYPKKVGKGYAFECFKKIKPTKELVDIMIEAIKKQKKSDMWKRDKGQYIPNPSTWLNQKRWEDDLDVDTDETPKLKLKFNGLNGLEF